MVSYEHDPGAASYGQEAAETLGLDPKTVFKTLLATLDGSETVVAIVPVANRLDLKALAKSAGAKKAVMADQNEATRITGYVLGGISPLGQRKRLRTFIDQSAAQQPEIHVSGGRRGLEIALAPNALVTLLHATFEPLAVTDQDTTETS